MPLFTCSKGNLKTSNPRGIKVKAKEIRGSARPISGLEKSSQSKKKTKKNSTIIAQPPPQPHATVMVQQF
jgi:hypothetical protein